jgi:hypothetical protein
MDHENVFQSINQWIERGENNLYRERAVERKFEMNRYKKFELWRGTDCRIRKGNSY